VIFFGGYGATSAQMKEWEAGAKKTAYGKEFVFRGYRYPQGASSSAASAVEKASATIRQLADEIDRHPEKRYIIVGHSSGAAISNRLATVIKDARNVKLIDLDGFAPSNALQEKVETICWYAKNSKQRLQSRNAATMKSRCAIKKAYEEPGCSTPWCLHMSLVTKKLGKGTNLDWLADEVAAKQERANKSKERDSVR
jgi:pimeloyl-ACP methyl ester carboxylesterase